MRGDTKDEQITLFMSKFIEYQLLQIKICEATST